MKKSRLWMFAAILIFSTMAVMAASTKDNMANDVGNEMEQYKETIRSWYGENKTIVDGNYDKSLAVKCINGTFVGKKVDNTIVFKGIPYVGQQPIGSLRWKAPVDATPNDGVYEAYYNAKAAPQPEVELSSIYYQGEDCLYLNIWKPATTAAEKKPVIVWVHGGAYSYGGTVDPLYDFHNFVEENPEVIVVSIAYRLGVLGFLHLSHLPDGKDYPDTQNLGLLDQLKVLKWVHENIAAFGGNPDNVTLMGESAGGGSVTNLSLIKGSHQYFKKVIALSGNPGLSTSTEAAIACTNELMDALGCKTVADLKKIDAQKLVGVASELLPLRMAPERDGNLLPRNPWEAVANGAVKGESYEPYCKWFSQLMFNAPCIRLSESQTKAGGKSFTYYFTVESALPMLKSAHGMALAPLFKHPEMDGDTGRAFDETFSKTMRKMFVQFAKTGNPSINADISPDGKAKEWQLYDVSDKQVMVFDEFNIHQAKESDVKIVDWDRTYFLTKYYML